MRLTPAQRRALTKLRDAEDALATGGLTSDYTEDEIVCSGIECWIGLNKTNWKLVLRLLSILAISDRSDHGFGDTVRRFRINDTGRTYLKDESQIDVALKLLRLNQPFTINKDGKVVRI